MNTFFQRYIDSWQFNGWLVHDIFLGVVLFIGILLLLYVVLKRRRKGVLLAVFVLYFLLSNMLMIVFGLAGREFPICSVSPVYTDPSEEIAVQMVEGLEHNGTSNGITHRIPHYLMVATNLDTGEKQWTHAASAKDHLIGYFMGGLLVHHRDGEMGALSLLDIKTGKEKLSEKEFASRHSMLINVLDSAANNVLLMQGKLYLAGVDGKYYSFDGKTLKEAPKVKDYLSVRFFLETNVPNYFSSHDQPLDDPGYQKMDDFIRSVHAEPAISALENLEPKVLDADMEVETALVAYQETKREHADRIMLLYNMAGHHMIWKKNIGTVNSDQQHPSVRLLKNTYAVQLGNEFVLLDRKTGKERFRYDLRWNEKIDRE